jgi:hypothetical protein
MASFKQQVLEKGKCPHCRSELIKYEYHVGCEIVTFEVMRNGKWETKKPDQISYDEWDDARKITEYECERCEIMFHTDDGKFIENG